MRYFWDGTKWAEREPPKPKRGLVVIPDLPGYKSPLGTGWIEGRYQRREDLKRHGCREVDPSEFKFEMKNPRYLARMQQGRRR